MKNKDIVTGFDGKCLCGKVSYHINRKQLDGIHCHCTMCRRLHGAAFATYVFAQPNQVTWKGSENLVAYKSSAKGYRDFCKYCGSCMRAHGQTDDDRIEIPAGTLSGDPQLTILRHIFVEKKVSWYQIKDDIPQYATWSTAHGPAKE